MIDVMDDSTNEQKNEWIGGGNFVKKRLYTMQQCKGMDALRAICVATK